MRALILDNIRSAENVGSILRTADAFGIDMVYLVGYTPAPLDRFGRPVAKLVKASLGAEKSVNWKQIANIDECVVNLKSKGVTILALEQAPGAATLTGYKAPASWALIVGNEVDGVASDALVAADAVIEIPMQGTKESLNVAVAAGIALHHLTA